LKDEKEKLDSLTAEEKLEKSRHIMQTRILTQEDFARIRRAQLAKKAGIKERRGLKRKSQQTTADELAEISSTNKG